MGVLLAEVAEGYRLYLRGNGPAATHRWPESLAFRAYLVAAALRLGLASLAVAGLAFTDVLCHSSLPFLVGLSTLKVTEVLFGYSAE